MVAQTLVGSTRSTIINRYAVTTLDPLIPNSFYSPQETRTGFKLLHQNRDRFPSRARTSDKQVMKLPQSHAYDHFSLQVGLHRH
jgi:hypothetical protein